MKRNNRQIFISALFIFFISIGFIACDKIDAPYTETAAPIDSVLPSGDCGNDGYVAANAVKKILLVDFTGHKCGNCPRAHEAAAAVNAQFGEKVITVAVHTTTTFAAPNGGGTKYLYDFRTTIGDDLGTTFGLESVGLPQGWVNRYDTAKFDDYTTWLSQGVPNALSQPVQAFLIIKNTFNSASKTLNTTINTHTLQSLTGNFKMCVWLIEDSVINWQKDYALPSGSQDIEFYHHKHPLRASITAATQGDLIDMGSTGTLQANACFSKSYTYVFPAAADWDAAKIKVVAFLYNTQTKEVVQAEEKALQ